MCQVVCECGRSDAHIYKTKQAAIDAWNTRATPKVKPLVWENFDAWTWWTRKPYKKTGGRVIKDATITSLQNRIKYLMSEVVS